MAVSRVYIIIYGRDSVLVDILSHPTWGLHISRTDFGGEFDEHLASHGDY